MEKTITVGNTLVHIEGSGEWVLVMLHGWPDTHEMWRPQVEFFRHHYVCASFTMPGFDREDRSDYSVDEVVERIGAIVDAVSPDNKVILLVHDWGCVFGYEYAMRNSHRVEKMIGLDVGDADSQELQDSLSVAGKLMVFTYQVLLAISFVLPRSLGNPLARLVARGLKARADSAKIHAGMSMPYAMRWFGANGGMRNLLPVEPSFPFYYGYATLKPMMFHSPQWLQRLQENPANKVQAFECSHWITVDKAAEFNTSAAEWLGR